MTEPARIRALVLAGMREGGDALSITHGTASKALIPIEGRPMISWVLDALALSHRIQDRPLVSGLDPAQAAAAGLDHEISHTARIRGGPAASLLGVIEDGIAPPLLVTTCDHALLTSGMVKHFLEQALSNGADLSVAMARKATISAAYPQTRRTYIPFRDEPRSGCNLFFIAGPAAKKVIEFWREAERHRKKPLRIMLHFGILTALGFLLRRPTADEVFTLISRRLGVRIALVDMPFAEAAIDVDTDADLELVRTIMRRRHT